MRARSARSLVVLALVVTLACERGETAVHRSSAGGQAAFAAGRRVVDFDRTRRVYHLS